MQLVSAAERIEVISRRSRPDGAMSKDIWLIRISPELQFPPKFRRLHYLERENTIKPRSYRFCPRSCATFLKSIAKTMADEKSIPVVDNHVTVSASESAQADSVIKEVPQKRWVSYLWDTFDKSPEERRFLFKLDAAVLTFASLGTFIISRDV
jgi:hypothetical protein